MSNKLNHSAIQQAIAASMMILGHCAPAAAVPFMIDVGGITIGDGQVGANPDTDPLANRIGFTVVIPGQFGATGTLIQNIAAGAASLTLTDLTIGHVGPPAGPINGNISFMSDLFAAIGPPATATVHLDGRYVKVGPAGELPAGGIINGADVQFTGFVNGLVPVGTVNPAGAAGVASNVLFGPPADPDVVTPLDFAVTSLAGSLPFELGVSDGIVLPASASVSVRATVPEPDSFTLFGMGILGLLGYSWSKRVKGARQKEGGESTG